MADRTKDFGVKFATSQQKQKDTVAADLYGGANTVSLGAGNLKFFKIMNIDDPPEVIQDQANNGTQSANYQETIGVFPSVDAETDIYTEGLVDQLVCSAGFEALDGPKDIGDATNYAHLILFNNRGKDQRPYTAAESALVPAGYLATDRINVYQTWARDLGPSTEIAKNVCIQQFEINGTSKAPLSMKMTGTAETVTRDAAHTGVDSWTKSATAFVSRFKMFNGAFEIGVKGGALSSVQILEMSLKTNFGMADNVPTGTSNSGKSRAEPLATGMSEVTLDVKIYKHDTDDWKNYEAGQTLLSAKAEFTQGDAFLGMYFPELQVTTAPIELADGSSVMLNCRAMIPTGTDPFSTERTVDSVEWDLPFTTPFYMKVVDTDDTNQMRKV